MNKKRWLLVSLIVIMLIGVIFVMPSFAGPGGTIAKAVVKTLWGKIFLSILAVIFLPVILYIVIREKIAEHRAFKDLKYMAQFDPNFKWLRVKERILDCFYHIHRAWSRKDLSKVSAYMTDWYWQNQQLVFLDKWSRQGLYNVCEVKKVKSVRPLLFFHQNEGGEHEDSLLVVSVTAYMKDYLVKKATRRVIEGDRRFKDHETIWSFTLTGGKWRVSNIEEAEFSLDYVRQIKYLPKIEDTVVNSDIKRGNLSSRNV